MSEKKDYLYWLFSGFLLFSSCSDSVRDAQPVGEQPAIYPDYVGVTIPVNIAPLNFSMTDPSALKIDAVVMAPNGKSLHGQGEESTGFDTGAWRELVASAAGDSLTVSVSAKYAEGWRSYEPFSIYVSTDSIDYGITYRLIEPGYEVWSKMGIYERNLSCYDQRALIENTQFEGCVNCHSTSRANPGDMTLHIRGKHGATLLQLDGNLQAYDTKTPLTAGNCVYPYWHPEGRYLAFSTNATQQSFHTVDAKRVEVFDSSSDLQIYDKQTNELLVSPLVKRDSVMETFPVFSADGRTLYFCAATQPKPEQIDLKEIRYNLCRIAFDPTTGTFGDRIDTLICAEAEGKSISFPRPSYDGRFLCFTLADYGQFSIWHKEADLYMLDLQRGALPSTSLSGLLETGFVWPLTSANSPDTESFHNWSGNSRWMVFSSRRDDGWFTRPYFTHINERGEATKPFMLPQESPKDYYESFFMSYNVPEFISVPSAFDGHHAADLVNSAERAKMGAREVK